MRINNAAPNNIKSLQSKNPTFSGFNPKELCKNGLDSAKNLFQLTRQGTMSRNLFIVNAYVFLLGSRLISSRDENEIRETLTRDVPTILLAAQGLPIFKTMIARKMHEKMGIPLFENVKTSKGVASSSQLSDWFVYNEKLHSGFDGFLDRLDKLGGNFNEICKPLGKDDAEIKTGLDKINAKTNKEFKEALSKDFKLKQLLENAFKSEKNAAFAKASWLRTIPSIFGFVCTLGLIGIFIPKFNIYLTEMLNKGKKLINPEVNKQEKVEKKD